MACLYTEDEIVAKLKELDEKMDEGITQSRLNTSQTDHQMSFSIRQAERQYEKYKSLLHRCYPATYLSMFGSNVIKFKGRQRGC